MIKDLVLRNRSYRRFHEDVPIEMATLHELVDLARLTSSGRNLQPLKYLLSCDRHHNALIFDTLAWAGYLKDWSGPPPGERPAAYIIVLGDTTITQSFGVDQGLAMTSILLGAVERNLGGCIVGSVNREKVRQLLDIPAALEILHVIALGKPKEKVVVDELAPGGDIRYWREPDGTHHVPKRRLEDIIVGQLG